MLGFIYRNTKEFKNINAMKLLFFSLVRSHLEFGSMIWSLKYDCYKNQIENSQNKSLKLLYNKLNISFDRDSNYLQVSHS